MTKFAVGIGIGTGEFSGCAKNSRKERWSIIIDNWLGRYYVLPLKTRIGVYLIFLMLTISYS